MYFCINIKFVNLYFLSNKAAPWAQYYQIVRSNLQTTRRILFVKNSLQKKMCLNPQSYTMCITKKLLIYLEIYVHKLTTFVLGCAKNLENPEKAKAINAKPV